MSIEKKFKYCVFFVAVVAGWVLSDMFRLTYKVKVIV